jgi:hypothetical protein
MLWESRISCALEGGYRGCFRHKSTERGIEKDAVRDMGAGFYGTALPGKKGVKGTAIANPERRE